MSSIDENKHKCQHDKGIIPGTNYKDLKVMWWRGPHDHFVHTKCKHVQVISHKMKYLNFLIFMIFD